MANTSNDIIVKKTIFSTNCLKLGVNEKDVFLDDKNNLKNICTCIDILQKVSRNVNFDIYSVFRYTKEILTIH